MCVLEACRSVGIRVKTYLSLHPEPLHCYTLSMLLVMFPTPWLPPIRPLDPYKRSANRTSRLYIRSLRATIPRPGELPSPTLHPTPSTLNLKPSALTPKPNAPASPTPDLT